MLRPHPFLCTVEVYKTTIVFINIDYCSHHCHGYHDHMMVLTMMIIRKMSEIPCFGRKNGVVDDHHNDDTMTMVMTMIMEMLW